jgi:hypothetical protein
MLWAPVTDANSKRTVELNLALVVAMEREDSRTGVHLAFQGIGDLPHKLSITETPEEILRSARMVSAGGTV